MVPGKHLVLSAFLEDYGVLRALRYLPKVLEWCNFLKVRLNGRIDRQTAREKTCGQFLAEIPEAERARREATFHDFCTAWNWAWDSVGKVGCLTFPAVYKTMVMDESKCISFCLPGSEDEGLCPVALISFLNTKHNELVQLVDEALLMRSKRTRQETTRAKSVSSRFMTSAHAFHCDQSEFRSFVEKQCVLATRSGYDFAKAEARLIDQYMSSLPAVDLFQIGFVYAHEQVGVISTLRQKVPQVPLSADTMDAIKKDFLNPAGAQRVLEYLEVVILFLGATGGKVVQTLDVNLGDMLLSFYMKTVLDQHDDLRNRVIMQQVRLKNLESLQLLLMEMTSSDVFEGVHLTYRKPLTDISRADLEAVCRNSAFLVDKVLAVFKSFALESLKQEGCGVKTSSPIIDILKFAELGEHYLEDLPWFMEFFPKSILMEEFISAYRLLEKHNHF